VIATLLFKWKMRDRKWDMGNELTRVFMVLLILLLVFTPLFLVTLYIFRWWWRRRFRVHLTTMFLGMLVAGCLVGLNASPTGIYGIHGISLSDDQFKVRDFYGWPLQVTLESVCEPGFSRRRPLFLRVFGSPRRIRFDFFDGDGL